MLRWEGLWPALYLFLTLLLMLTVAAGDLSFRWRDSGFAFSKSNIFQVWLVATALLLFLSIRHRRRPAAFFPDENYWLPLVLVTSLVLFMASGVRHGDWYFFLNPRAVIWMIVLAPLFAIAVEIIERKNAGRIIYPVLLIAAQAYLVFILYQSTGGQPIYRDDHPSFLYRFWILTQSFPRIFFYNPLWNGGYVGTELVTTGALSLGYPALPFMAIFGVENVYLLFLAGVFIVAIPWITYATVRSLGWSIMAAWVAAFLSLGCNRFFFVNFLTYGTTPSLLSSFLLIVVWAVIYGAVKKGFIGLRRWLVLVISLNLMIFWPPSAIILLPVGLALIADMRGLNRRSLFFLISAALLLALVNGVWFYRYVSHPKVIAFFTHESVRQSILSLHTAMRSLSGGLKQTNPLILVAGFLGLIWPGGKKEYRWLIIPVFFYMIMIGIGLQVKPHLQLHRMIIPLSFFLLIPAASLISRTTSRRDIPSSMVRGFAAALIMLTVLNIGGIFQKRGKETFWPMNDEIKGMIAWIREKVPSEGRVFFGGRTVHGYGGGHVAYLQSATGRNMIAGDYYHFDPRLADYNPVPVCFRGSMNKLRRYFNLMGVTHVVTHDQKWKDLLDRRKKYRFECAFGEKYIFNTGVKPGLLMKGEGKVGASINKIEVSLEKPEKDVILRFLWQDGLRSDPPVILKPVKVAADMFFIGASTGKVTHFEIRYDP